MHGYIYNLSNLSFSFNRLAKKNQCIHKTIPYTTVRYKTYQATKNKFEYIGEAGLRTF